MFCSLVHVLVKTKAMPSMVGKLIFKIEALSFQVFIKYFKFIKFVVFIFFLTDVFFDFQFCEYRILDFMEVKHCPETVAVSKYNILYETYKSSIQPQFQWYIVIRRWQFSHLGTLKQCCSQIRVNAMLKMPALELNSISVTVPNGLGHRN